ncbi:hypothetical protein [Rubellimicrobium sp. CFH 75288]|uniref:hypothetical protein n=1 Tax=Rubellimicrobium sp. CFH 75288 TaxID=2697034 RepID=UPI00141252D6|nr:hypothetical protein [Rubellimicrobium sp. CFH 75288]NAZ35300.1 hypothetical protein [Rubellimicrobium sp. CFH 75288]
MPLRLTTGGRILARLDDIAARLGSRPDDGDWTRAMAEMEARLSAQIAMQGEIIDALVAERGAPAAGGDLAARQERLERRLAAIEDAVAGLEGPVPALILRCAERIGAVAARLTEGTSPGPADDTLRPGRVGGALGLLVARLGELDAALGDGPRPAPAEAPASPAPATDDLGDDLAEAVRRALSPGGPDGTEGDGGRVVGADQIADRALTNTA